MKCFQMLFDSSQVTYHVEIQRKYDVSSRLLYADISGASGAVPEEGHCYRSEVQLLSNRFWWLRYLPVGDYYRLYQISRVGLIDQSSEGSVQMV